MVSAIAAAVTVAAAISTAVSVVIASVPVTVAAGYMRRVVHWSVAVTTTAVPAVAVPVPAVVPATTPVVVRILLSAAIVVAGARRAVVAVVAPIAWNVRVVGRRARTAPIDDAIADTASVFDLPCRVLVARRLELVPWAGVDHAPAVATTIRVVLRFIVDDDVIANARMRVHVPIRTTVVTVITDEAWVLVAAADVILRVIHRIVVVPVEDDALGEPVHRHERVALDIGQPVIVPVAAAAVLRQSQLVRADDREDVADPRAIVGGKGTPAVAIHLTRFARPRARIVVRAPGIEHVDPSVGVDPSDHDESILCRPESDANVFAALHDVAARRP